MLPINMLDARLDRLAGTSKELEIPEGTLAALNSLAANPPPATLNDLTNEDTFVSLLSVEAAASLGIPFGSAESKTARRIVVQEYAKYRDIMEGTTAVRWGVGVRWIVNVKILNTEAKISSVPMVAASAQVGFVEATARFQVLGIASPEVTKAIPAPTDLNTETYVELKQALLKIKALIYEQATTIRPQVLAITADAPETSERSYEGALAVAWALTKISEGRTLLRAQTEYEKSSAFFREEVKSVYIDVASTSDANSKPSDEARAKARRILNDLSVRD